MRTIHRSRAAQIVAPLAALALACQLANKDGRESRSTSPDRSQAAALPAPPPAEPVVIATDDTTASRTAEDSARAPVPCAATELRYPEVKAACAEDGRRAVKKIMIAAIAKAKRAGTELECSSCHLDQKTFGLRPNAVDDLAPWL